MGIDGFDEWDLRGGVPVIPGEGFFKGTIILLAQGIPFFYNSSMHSVRGSAFQYFYYSKL